MGSGAIKRLSETLDQVLEQNRQIALLVVGLRERVEALEAKAVPEDGREFEEADLGNLPPG